MRVFLWLLLGPLLRLLLLVAVTLYFGTTLLGKGLDRGGAANLPPIRDELATLGLVRDAVTEAVAYASHPDPAHRAELDVIRAQLCSLLNC